MESQSRELLERYHGGDQDAAAEIFNRYKNRLIALARKQMSNKLQRRVGPDDVVQLAYKSFFRRAEKGDFEVNRSGDLWRLLAAITVHKVLKQVEKHCADVRSIDAEETIGSATLGLPADRIVADPTASEAAVMFEELQLVMKELIPLHRKMLKLRLTGQSVADISIETERTETQVRRVLKKVRQSLEEKLVHCSQA